MFSANVGSILAATPSPASKGRIVGAAEEKRGDVAMSNYARTAPPLGLAVLRYARRHLGFLGGLLITAVAVGIASATRSTGPKSERSPITSAAASTRSA
jgi:hypothetical protein